MRYCPRTLQDFVQSHSPFSPAKDALGEFGQSLELYLVGIADFQSSKDAPRISMIKNLINNNFRYF